MLTAQQAINDFKPKAFLLLGIAFGVDRKKQRMGDVLVATSIFPYELQRKGKEVVFRDDPMKCGEVLSERFRVYEPYWKLMAGPRQIGAIPGQVLSGQKLVDDKKFRDDLIRGVPKAKGGEMEGHGAYAAAEKTKTEMILVKGICDWADGHKNDRAQPFAAYAAVSLAEYVLSKPDVLMNLKADDVNGGNSRKAPSKKVAGAKVNASRRSATKVKASRPA
jgi:nucleoside phosphorylase